MTDIVERLHWLVKEDPWQPRVEIAAQAAAEIERLRTALRSIVQGWDWWGDDPYNRCQSVPGDAIEEARALLTEDGR